MFFADVFLAAAAGVSLGGDKKATPDAPSSRVSSVVSMLGDFKAFCASFLTLGDVIAAGALHPTILPGKDATYRL